MYKVLCVNYMVVFLRNCSMYIELNDVYSSDIHGGEKRGGGGRRGKRYVCVGTLWKALCISLADSALTRSALAWQGSGPGRGGGRGLYLLIYWSCVRLRSHLSVGQGELSLHPIKWMLVTGPSI